MTGITTAFGALRVTFLGVPLLALTVSCASTQAPDVTHDGLVKIPESEFALVYAKPDVSVADYTEFAIADCDVAFRKNWLRDQNTGNRTVLNRVGEDDVKRIREALSSLCTEEFTAALTTSPEYKLVSMADVGANAGGNAAADVTNLVEGCIFPHFSQRNLRKHGEVREGGAAHVVKNRFAIQRESAGVVWHYALALGFANGLAKIGFGMQTKVALAAFGGV